MDALDRLLAELGIASTSNMQSIIDELSAEWDEIPDFCPYCGLPAEYCDGHSYSAYD